MAGVADGKVQFDSRYNYQKIFAEGSQAMSVSNPNSETTFTVVHNLGKYKFVRVWWVNANGYMCEASNADVSFWAPGFSVPGSHDLIVYYYNYIDRVEIRFNRTVTSGSTANTTVYWRIYYEDA